MDKSFNDQELSDIMKEIEALEQDFVAAPELKSDAPVAEVVETEASVESVEETPIETFVSEEVVAEAECVEECEEIEARHGVGEEKNEVSPTINNIVAFEHKSAPEQKQTGALTSMSFKVAGNLTLELQFDIGGKTVALEVTESGLSIEMEGGMKFTAPMTQKSDLKKAI
jgi:hypothetical protein